MKKARILFAILTVAIFGALAMSPAVLAEDITTYEFGTYRLMWGNGIDDNGDGVIDDTGEPDVRFGNESINITKYTTDGWSASFDNLSGYNFSVDKGIIVAGHAEALWDITSSSNGSVAPTETCYETGLEPDYPPLLFYNTNYTVVNNVLPVVAFMMNLSSLDIMNGCQEFWYRSPLAWDSTIFQTNGSIPYHYLNIYRVSDGELMWASPEIETKYWANPGYGTGTPKFKLASDNSTDISGYERVYYKINFPMRSDTKYRFEEYVKTVGDAPVNSIKVWICNAQDIGNDNITQTYIFKGTSNARAIPVEPSFGMIVTWGIGRAGVENPVFGSSYGSTMQEIVTQANQGSMTDEVFSLQVIIPLRMTNKTNIFFDIAIRNIDYTNFYHKSIGVYNVTGTVVVEFNITDPCPGEIKYYALDIFVDGIYGDDTALMYTMYEQDGVNHRIENTLGIENNTQYFNNFAVEFSISESNAPIGENQKGTFDLTYYLLGWALVLAGGLLTLTAIYAPVGVSLMYAGIVIGLATMLIGGQMQIHAMMGGTLSNFTEWLTEGWVRAFGGVFDGITNLFGGLIDVILGVWKAIVNLGQNILYWGGLILEAIWQIIWFLAFLIVLWGVSKLLDVFTNVAELRFGKALKEIESTGENIRSRGTKYILPPATRTVKYAHKKYNERRNRDEED
jgi:hypothetical protein